MKALRLKLPKDMYVLQQSLGMNENGTKSVTVIKILFYRWQTLKCTPLKIREAQLKQLWQVICCVCQVLMVITKAFRMQFLICCGHDRKTKSQLGFSCCYFVSIQPVGNML